MKQLESLEQTRRYSRHIMLPAMDLAGQERLLNSRVLIVGMGGLGCAAAPYLASSGVGTLTLVDGDSIDVTNLQRQILYTETDIGENKAIIASKRLRLLEPSCDIRTFPSFVSEQELAGLVSSHDLVLDCTDNLPTRLAINDVCVEYKIPLVSASAIRFEGQICCFENLGSGPCYRCVSHMFGEQNLNCLEAGIFAPVVGVVGTSQACLALQILAKVGDVPWHQLRLFDGLHHDWQTFKIPVNIGCKCNHVPC